MIEASIVIPALNCRPYLEKTLCGLSLQMYDPARFEVIVSDDGSTDGTTDLVERFRCPYRLRLVCGPQRRQVIGLASVRNRGIRAASGRVVITLDADCVPVPWFVELHLAHFHAAAAPLVVVGLRRFIAGEVLRDALILRSGVSLLQIPEVVSASNFGRLRDRRLPELAAFDRHPMPFNCFHTCNASFTRRDAFLAGLFDEDFDGHWGYEDVEFGYRLWRLGAKFCYDSRALVLHQENTLHTLESRLAGKAVNFEIACANIPGFRAFRRELGR